MNQLIERMLAVRARLPPHDRTRRVVDPRAVQTDVLAVALHRELLQVRRESLEILIVWQHRERSRAEEVGIPDGQQSEEDREVFLEWRRAKVLVHRVKAAEHLVETIWSDREHRR